MSTPTFLKWLHEVELKDIPTVGGKNASLGEMIQHLGKLGVQVPGGFVVTVASYEAFIAHNELDQKIHDIVAGLDTDDVENIRRTGLAVRTLIKNGKFPEEIWKGIMARYDELSQKYGQDATDVAVRSSATAEDLPDASFAGQQETFLNIRGHQDLISAVRNCFASLWTDRAIVYRQSLGYDHFNVGISVGVQKMVRSDLGASGVAFSLDTESGFRDVVLINGSYGLGEMVVQGAVSPDEFLVFKPTLAEGYSAIIEKKIGNKDRKMIYGVEPGKPTLTIPTERAMRNRFCISDDQALEIARGVTAIEKYYSAKKGHWCPMDVEWAVDGLSKQLFIVQARPETIHSRKATDRVVEYRLDAASMSGGASPEVIAKGVAIGDKVGAGKVRILFSLDGRGGGTDGKDFQQGDVLVTDMTDPDWEPIMKKASAIITNKGGRTCHAAIVAREMGVPAIVGCGNATDLLDTGMEVTASCCEGDTGVIYKGIVPFTREETMLNDLPEVRTPIMLNVASPDLAFKFAALPNAGVGLAREEFLINNYIQAHPLALLQHKELGDVALSGKISYLINGYEDEETFFVKRLSYGIAKIAAAFHPNKVIVRFSDFKSNEYKNLLGGEHFEPDEENPMIGWRGASRYYSDAYKEAFGLECKALRRVREKMGLKNVVVMVPFCRTVEELKKVMAVMKEYGLERGKEGLELYLMAEIPSNIILAEEFAQYIDGFSIGSNDLTQLTLGLDRDSALVSHIYDERNEAVKGMIRSLISSAKRTGTKVGICGQGPSDFPDFAQFLVELGIDTISVTPDSLLKTRRAIAEVEKTITAKGSKARIQAN
ncbi:MAG: phosphoenolpyruvate synthase [Bacteroidetes bacterium]|nr:phosphoenolpyruvate synthase [Bacteroidota bacterium]MBX7128983.1 phosphoenolpyruvate synthase [Flavobacteriales bacterium]MCC6655501.1 phosphoenolpyruvate synthase [Flavobacteriales bacterium]HMU12686.1 phosphoenolpyruvate synthase [Flavobacteriales bacterium]HNK67716.1 phosphoenolpyruvate synthase [Flavobacteriales bacterium]